MVDSSIDLMASTDFVLVDDEPQWITEHQKRQRKDAFLRRKHDLQARLEKVRAKELRQKQRYESGESLSKRAVCLRTTPIPVHTLSLVTETRPWECKDIKARGRG